MTNIKNQTIIWKPYPEYPFVEANQFGEIRAKDRYIKTKNGPRFVKGRVLKQRDNGCGYMRVSFCVNGKYIDLYVHRIVATCFLDNPDNLPEINHIDCNPRNNAVSNLECCTHQENTAYRDELGHTAKHNAPKKPLIAINLRTSNVQYFESQHEAARQLRASQGHISDVLKGRMEKTHGYWFAYVDENTIEKVRERFSDEIASKVEKLINDDL